MKSTFILSIAMLIASVLRAQVPEDALRMSWLNQNGTARSQAIGGAMGSLGGDISTTFTNPAGIGFYKTGEFVLSPGFNSLSTKTNFRGSDASDKKTTFNFGTSGLVLGFGNQNGKWKGGAFSIAVNRTANFSSNVYYKGENDFSSYSEQYASELANSGIPIAQALDYNAALSLGTKMAIYSYLIDTATVNGSKQVVGLPEFVANRQQENSVVTTGGITEIALGIAGNLNDKFYVGGSLGLPIVNYERNTTFTESDITGDNNNDFESSTLKENYTTKGIGLNAKLGIIFKPVSNIRVGLAIHTPTIYGLQDTYSGSMRTNTENYPPSPGVVDVTSDVVSGTNVSQFKYDMLSPWKAMISGSYIFGELEDVKKQKGFISADLEFINYKGSSYQTADPNSTDDGYYRDINNTIDDVYKGSINARLGGELKFNTLMARAGFAYCGNPYQESELKSDRKLVSVGLGYRDNGFFLDLTYVYAMQKDVNFPYRLSDKANTFAELKGTGSNVVVTAGFKF